MKLLCLVTFMLLAYAHAAVKFHEETGGSVTAILGDQRLNLKASYGESKAIEDDKLMSAELVELERNQRNLVANAIKYLLESFRDVVINGNDDVPPLDPFIIQQIGPFIHTDLGVRATASIHNFRMDGLRWYVVEDVSVDVLRLALGLKVIVPHLTFTGTYHAQAFIGFLSHVSGGDYRIFINRLEVSADTRVGTNILGGGHLFLRELDVNINIHDVNIRIEGMVGSSVLNSLINAWVQNVTQNLLQNELEAVSQRISEELFSVIDEVLRDFTLNDLLG